MEASEKPFGALADVPDAKWRALSTKRIYFAHMSVGDNIIAGLRDIMNENKQIRLNIVEAESLDDIVGGALFHSKIGYNADPLKKIDQFERIMAKSKGKAIDIAFLKLCYVDVTAGTNTEKLFARYVQSMQKLQAADGKVKILHFTVPLTTLQTGPKAWIKKILGRPIAGVDDNMNRSVYNDKVRQHVPADALIDIALVESTSMEGRREEFEKGSARYHCLVPEYTYDGGHLNETGRRLAAERMLLVLVNQI